MSSDTPRSAAEARERVRKLTKWCREHPPAGGRRRDVSKPLIIYHGKCYDGFTSAWIAAKALNEQQGAVPELHAARYGDPPPKVDGRHVFVLDFSYPRSVMEFMHRRAASLLVLDHHKTAAEACEGLTFCTFDMERSGCGLTWDHFYMPTFSRPAWVNHVEDRDLWRFALDGTREVHAYIASLPMTFDAWDNLAATPIEEVKAGGRAIAQYIDTYCDKASEEARIITWNGTPLALVNVPYQNASEMASYLLKKHPEARFACGWFVRADGHIQFSLRSRGDYDVAEEAKKLGGGGHAGAAGFDLPFEQGIEWVQPEDPHAAD